MLEKIILTAENAVQADVISYSQACLSFDQFRNYQETGEVCARLANALATTIGGRIPDQHPNRQSLAKKQQNKVAGKERIFDLRRGFFEEKPRREKQPKNILPQNERTPTSVAQ